MDVTSRTNIVWISLHQVHSLEFAHTKHKNTVPCSCISVADPGEGPWWPTPPPLFLDQTEDQRAAKKLFF